MVAWGKRDSERSPRLQIVVLCAPEVAREKAILPGSSYSAALPGRWKIGFPDPGLHSQAH